MSPAGAIADMIAPVQPKRPASTVAEAPGVEAPAAKRRKMAGSRVPEMQAVDAATPVAEALAVCLKCDPNDKSNNAPGHQPTHGNVRVSRRSCCGMCVLCLHRFGGSKHIKSSLTDARMIPLLDSEICLEMDLSSFQAGRGGRLNID